ncbi:MAG TPA: type II secretion system protein GspJ [Rhodanobacter sp.]|nr:type II secretion system protein GspJ [Rhodanobacter sp.]
MNVERIRGAHGFTLIELLSALLVLSLLSLMAYRGLGVVMASRDHIQAESTQWRQAEAFFTRFERDVRLAAPRRVRSAAGSAPAWRGRPEATQGPLLEFSRFAGSTGTDTPRRIGYGLNGAHQIELWIWPALDVAADTPPTRYVVLGNVLGLHLQYLSPALTWKTAWPTVPTDPPLPLAVRMQVQFGSGETVVRVFALHS